MNVRMDFSRPTPVSLAALAAALVFSMASSCRPSPGGGDGGAVVNAECTRDSDCISGHCPTIPGEAQKCRAECLPDGTCETGSACTVVGTSRLCLPLLEARSAGNRCQASRQCASGMCAGLRAEDAGVCVEQCPGDETCPVNLYCAVDQRVSARPFCVPPLDTRTNGSECTNGRECEGGRCMGWGGRAQCAAGCAGGCNADAGFNCVAQEANGSACLQLLDNAARCGSNPECASGACFQWDAGGVCVGECGVDQACPTGSACVLLQGQTVRKCVPLRDMRGAGETCASPDECQSGRCARFGTTDFDAGVMCADPCDAGTCNTGLVCWGEDRDAGLRGLCGPRPF